MTTHESNPTPGDIHQKLEQLQRSHGMEAMRAQLGPVSAGLKVQLAVAALLVLWSGNYWVSHLGETPLVVYGVIVHLYGLAVLISSILRLSQLAAIDHRAPVGKIQAQLAAIRRLRVGSERLLLLSGFVVWVPVVLISLNAVGFDVWNASSTVVVCNVLASLGLGVLAAWLTTRFRGAFERDAAGRGLREAEAELSGLALDAARAV